VRNALCYSSTMRCVTGPIDGGTILQRALVLANDPDGCLAWRRLYVLPPGAPYHIDRRGNVYAVPWRKRTHRAGVEKCILDMRRAFDGVVPRKLTVTSRAATKLKRLADGQQGYEMVEIKIHQLRLPGSHWWAPKFIDGRETSEAEHWVVPTLDALVGAAHALLLRPGVRGLFGRCPHCGLYFLRPSGWRKAACSEEHWREHRKLQSGARVKEKRKRDRKKRDEEKVRNARAMKK
jgi:hypothetical protein